MRILMISIHPRKVYQIFYCLKPTLFIDLIVKSGNGIIIHALHMKSYLIMLLIWSSQTDTDACNFLALFGTKILLITVISPKQL